MQLHDVGNAIAPSSVAEIFIPTISSPISFRTVCWISIIFRAFYVLFPEHQQPVPTLIILLDECGFVPSVLASWFIFPRVWFSTEQQISHHRLSPLRFAHSASELVGTNDATEWETERETEVLGEERDERTNSIEKREHFNWRRKALQLWKQLTRN